MSVTVTPISETVGVEVVGLSGAELPDRLRADECLELLDRHGVVVYRECHISDPDLVAFSRLLGEVVVAPMGGLDAYPEVSPISFDPAVSTLAAYRTGTFYWHLDGANDAVPQKATLLVAREVAEEGGDTEFANTYAAYEALPDSEKRALEGVRALHSFGAAQRNTFPNPTAKQLDAWAKIPTREHPVVWTRPDGRRSILVGNTTDTIVGMAAEEGRALLGHLLEWCTQPQFVLRHKWRMGDLVVWDNTGMLHRAEPYATTSKRLMHRTTLVGDHAVA